MTGPTSPEFADGAPGRRTIVVRGDLFSDTGYGHATRALSRLLAGCGDHVFGLSLHEHAQRRQNAFPFTVISQDALLHDPRFNGCCVVHVCLPGDFITVTHARNIGYFFWETEQFPPRGFWKARMRLMDELWAPSRWQARLLARETGRTDIAVVPWPQAPVTVSASSREAALDVLAHPPSTLEQLSNYFLRASGDPAHRADQQREQAEHDAGRSQRFDPEASPRLRRLREGGGDLYVAVQTDAPRKGLAILLAAWLQFRQTPEGRDAKLIIKLSSIDVTIDFYRLHFNASLAVRRSMRRLALDDPGIHFVYDRLASETMSALISCGDAFVSATMGEGFGGPLAEAFAVGVPVICPFHTSCSDIMGENYPLAVASVASRQKLWNNIDVYSPSSVWNIADDGDFTRVLQRFARTSAADRRAIAARAAAGIEDRMGAAAVGTTLARQIGRPLAALRYDVPSGTQGNMH